MTELVELTATEIAAAVRGGTVTRREVVEAHARRIDTANGSVNAFVSLRLDAAVREAAEADRRRCPSDGLPLDGVPVSIKDVYDVEGLPTTLGLPIRRDMIAPRNELLVTRLRAAGAIVLGKTNMPDLGPRWNTISSLHGATRNPRDLAKSAGGSSGGDAAAVAAGMATVGLGGDLGGSLRVPASFCEILGFRPSSGVVPKVSVLPPQDFPPAFDLMHSSGPVARSVDDLETVFNVLAGVAIQDPSSWPVGLPAASKGRGRIALLLHETGANIDVEIEAAVRVTAEALRDEGYEVVEGVVPDLRRAPELWAEILGTELLYDAMDALGAHLGESGRQHIETMFGLFDGGGDAQQYMRSFVERRALVRTVSAWMEEYPLILAPVAGMRTPRLDFDHLLTVEATRNLFDRMRCVPWVNLLGLPSVALGNGSQIIARRLHDRDALAAARDARLTFGPISVAAPTAWIGAA